MSFINLFVRGTLGAGCATFVFQILNQALVHHRLDLPVIGIYAFCVGTIYGYYFAALHARRYVTQFSAFICGVITMMTLMLMVLLAAAISGEQLDVSAVTLIAVAGLAIFSGAAGYVASTVGLRN